MRLTKIYIESFGVLRDYNYTPTAGFNQIYGENGAGKSTLAAFIRAMLFGMPQTRTRKLLDEAERKKYKPWHGGSFGGYICFEENGKEYRVARTFGDRESEDTFSLIDEATGLVSNDYSSDIGREIFGIDREAFGSTIWIGSKNMPVAVNDSIHAKLSLAGENKTTTLGCDIDNYDKGIERLNEAYKQYVRTGRRGLIYETEDEIADQKLRLQEKQKRLHAVEGMIESLNRRIENRYMSARRKNEAVHNMDDGSWRKRLQWLDDYFSKGVPEESDIGNNIAANERRLQLLDIEKEKQERKRKNSKKMIAALSIPLILSLIAVVITMVMIVIPAAAKADDMQSAGITDAANTTAYTTTLTIALVIGIAVFAGLGTWLMIIISRFNKSKSAIKELIAQAEQLKKTNDNLKEQRSLIAEYSYLSEKDMYREKLEKQLDVQKYKLELDNYCKEQEEINSEIMNIRHNINGKQEALKKYNYNAEIIKKTGEYLTEARNSYVLGYKDLIAGKMADYLACFDKKLAASLELDADFVVSIAIGAVNKDLDYFSSGIKDIIWFCERISIIDAIFDGEPFIIMDDTFINLDDDMLGKALELTAELSEKRQIIYMTCRKSNMYIKKD